MNIRTIMAEVANMTDVEIRELHRQLTDFYKQRIRKAAAAASWTLHRGQHVQWTSRGGLKFTGTVESIGPKNTVVLATDGRKWRVTNTMLSSAAPPPTPVGYTADASQFVHKKTRRGVNTTCPIQRNGKTIATLEDVAEQIVAKVTFTSTPEKLKFMAEAKKKYPDLSDDHAVSELARQITMDA